MAARAPDDRTVRRRSGAQRRHLLRRVVVRLRRAASATSSRSSPTSTTPSSIRRISIRSRSSTSRPTSASSRRTRSRWRAPSSNFRIPRDVLTVCLGKSTYARCGIIVNVTPFEPEWEGHVTIEISNTTPLPAKIYANEGIAQVLFFQSDDVVRGVVQGQEREVPGAAGRHAAEAVVIRFSYSPVIIINLTSDPRPV